MKVNVEIEPTIDEIEILIKTYGMTAEVQQIIEKLQAAPMGTIAGFADGMISILEAEAIIRIYALNKKVYAKTISGEEYVIRLTLKELESRLSTSDFVRISNSEIVKLSAIRKLDVSFAGAIGMILSNHEKTFVSRRYVSKIKEKLGTLIVFYVILRFQAFIHF
jgi:predicted metallopeptidase